jgi:PAS domain S-box-containing protein
MNYAQPAAGINQKNDFRVFECLPAISAVVRADPPRYSIVAVTEEFTCITGLKREELIGKGHFEPFPESPADPHLSGEANMRASYDYILIHKKPHSLPVQRYDLPNKDGSFTERYWRASNKPIFDEEGAVEFILHTAIDVTEEVKAGRIQERIKGMEQVHNLFMQAPVAIAIVKGKQLIIELANEPIITVWGKGSEVVGKSILEIMPEVASQGFIDLMHKVRETGTAYEAYEAPVRLIRNGKEELVYFNFVYQPYYEINAGKPTGIMIFATEVTEQVLARKKVRESEQNLQLAMEIGELGFFHINYLTLNATYSQRIKDWFGFKEDNLPLDVVFTCIHPEDRKEVIENIKKSVEGAWNGRHDLTYRIIHPETGQVFYLRSIGEVQYENKVPVAISGIIQDVTAQVKALKSLEESELRFRTLADQSPMIVYLIEPNAEASISYFNKSWLDYTGQTLEEALGRTWDAIVHPHDVQTVLDIYVPAFENRKSYTLPSVRLKRYDGQYRWHLFKGNPRYLPNGEFIGFVGVGIDIHDQKAGEQALLENSEKFRNLLEALPQITWTNLPSGDVNFYNQRWYSYTGLNYEQTKEWSWQAVIHPEELDNTVETYFSSLKAGNVFEMENRLRRVDGEFRWHLNRAVPIKNEKEEIILWIGTATDIHDRKQMENELKQNEQKIRSLIENAPFPIAVYVGKDMIIEFANQAVLDAWGKGKHVIGKRYADVLPELNNQEIFSRLDSVYRTGIAVHGRNERIDLLVNGVMQSHYFNYSFTPLFHADGSVYGVMNTAAEVTDLHLAKQKVERSETNLRNMVLQAPVAMCILLGPSHIIEVANDLMITLWGKPKDDVIFRPIFEALPDAREQGFEQLLAQVYQTGETFKASERPVTLLRNGKSETVYQSFVYEPYTDADGQILGILAVAIDVTEQVLARNKIQEVVAERTKELAEANLQLQQSNEELNEFAYIASHDLQEPLRKVRTFTDLMQRSLGEIPEMAGIYINKIKHSAERMQSLINDVLMFSLLSKERASYQQVDSNLMLRHALEDFELLIEQKGAIIQAGELPVLEAIPVQLRQLFNNLISNALKFSSPQRTPEISITCKPLSREEVIKHQNLDPDKLHYRLEFKDNGIGFQQEHASKIFTIFQRLHGRLDYEGTGIGLAMCKKIVQNHHGNIYAHALPDQGANFIIILPATQKNAA